MVRRFGKLGNIITIQAGEKLTQLSTSKKNTVRESGALLLSLAISSPVVTEREREISLVYERGWRHGRRRAKGEVNQRRNRMVESRNGERGLKDFSIQVFNREGVEYRAECKELCMIHYN